jgi:hypothetical protein
MTYVKFNLATEARKALTNRKTKVPEALVLMMLAEAYLKSGK